MTAVSDLDQEFAADDFEAEVAAVLSAADEIAETAAADVVTTAALDAEIDAELIVDAAVIEIEAEIAAEADVEAEEEEEDPVAAFKEQMRISPGDWYVIHSYAGYENKVKGNLESRLVSLNVEDYIFQIEVPMEEVTEIKGGVRKLVRRNKFPGYVLVRMELTDESWGVVRHTPGVTGFVGHGHQPAPLTLDEVVAILAPVPEKKAGAPGAPAARVARHRVHRLSKSTSRSATRSPWSMVRSPRCTPRSPRSTSKRRRSPAWSRSSAARPRSSSPSARSRRTTELLRGNPQIA
jgi:transcription termination/antitermination protein NusG